MRAIILAAGIGSRLKPITDKKPKALVKVNGKPILGYVIDSLVENGIKDIVICVGYKEEEIKHYCDSQYPIVNIKYVENHRYLETNNMYSLYLASGYFDQDILLMNGDVIHQPGIVGKLIAMPCSAVAVDTKAYYEESMKIVVRDGYIKGISKTILKGDAYGCSIDVYKINKTDIANVKSEMTQIIEIDKNENQWTEVMLDKLFGGGKLLAEPCDIGDNKWFEIDNYDDLAKAEVMFNQKISELKGKKVFFLDKDGTVAIQDRQIEGANAFIAKAREKGKTVLILSNNSSKTPSSTYAALCNAGLKIQENEVLLSTQAAIREFQNNSISRVFWLASQEVSNYLLDNGFVFEEKNPQALLLTYDVELTYKKMVQMVKFVRRGIPYYATHTDIVCPTIDGYIPDIGTYIHMIQVSTGKLPIKTFGKPNISMIEDVIKTLGCRFSDAVIIGDRLYTDIVMAENTEMISILVLTGETTREQYEEQPIKADILLKSLKELVDLL